MFFRLHQEFYKSSSLPHVPTIFTNRKPLMTTPPLGIYRHYKGNLYQLLHIACHSETEEPLAVYRALYGNYGVWVRPLAMFTENVVTEQGSVARFALVKAVD